MVDSSPADLLEGSWWLVHTRSRQEKALGVELDRRGINFFLPLVRTRRRYSGRMFNVELPLFPSYLFLCGDEDDRYAALMTHRAAKVVPVADQAQLRHELHQVWFLMRSAEQIDLYPALVKGRRVRVVSGSLQGLEGIILRRRDKYRLHVGVEVLGQSAELEIDASLVEAID